MAAVLAHPSQVSTDGIATLRGPAALTEQDKTPLMMPFVNNDVRESRNYPEQPSVIPHRLPDMLQVPGWQ